MYLRAVSRGDLGRSVQSRRPVLDDLMAHFPAASRLSLFSLVFRCWPSRSGIVAATRRNGSVDHVSRVTALLGISLPIFWSGLMLQLVFYKHLSWFPYGGRLSSGVDAFSLVDGPLLIDSLLALRGAVFVDALWHLVMPGLAMSGITIAVLSRMTRASMLEVLRREYPGWRAPRGCRSDA